MQSDPSRNKEVQEGQNLERRNQDDPKEVAIRQKIEECISLSDWAPEALREVRDLQKDCMVQSLENKDDPAQVRKLSNQAFREIADLYRAHIADEESREVLRKVTKGSPAIVTTNHLGLYKSCSIDTADLGIDMKGYPKMYPFWAYSAGLQALADELDCNLSYVSNQFPGVFDEVHQAAGFVHVDPTDERGGLAGVLSQVLDLTEERADTMVVYFPEGTTSGKPNMSDPYDLAPYHRGAYAVAHDLEIPRILAVQFFHPEKGLMIKVLDVANVPTQGDSKTICGEFAQADRTQSQAWLDGMMAEIYPEILRTRKRAA